MAWVCIHYRVELVYISKIKINDQSNYTSDEYMLWKYCGLSVDAV